MSACASCHQREGTIRWGDAFAVTHGFLRMLCEVCALTKQIEHAEERAALLPDLRARLAELTSAAPGSSSGRTPGFDPGDAGSTPAPGTASATDDLGSSPKENSGGAAAGDTTE